MRRLGVTAPVVWIENNTQYLQKKFYWTCLPNNVLQPVNLYQKIVDLLKQNTDELGLVTINKVFANHGHLPSPNIGHSISAKDASEAPLEGLELEIKAELKRAASSEASTNEVQLQISKYSVKNSLPDCDRIEADEIATELVEQHGFASIRDVRSFSLGSLINLLSRQPSEFGRRMLKEVFTLADKCAFHVDLINCIGKGYDILRDQLNFATILQTPDHHLKERSDIGLKISPFMCCSRVQQEVTYMDYYGSEIEYVKDRLKKLGVAMDVDCTIFKMKSREGFTRSPDQTMPPSNIQHSFLYEKRLFKLEVDPNDDLRFRLNFRFIESVKNLPMAYNKEEPRNGIEFQDFFDLWGHFTVKSAYAGGTVELKLNITDNSDTSDAILGARTQIEAAFHNATVGSNFATSSNPTVDPRIHLVWNGGNSRFHVQTLSEIHPGMWKQWENSLSQYPKVLTTDMSLCPISDMVGLVDKRKKDACQEALKDILGGNFKMVLKMDTDANKERGMWKAKEEPKNPQQAAKMNAPDDREKQKCFSGNCEVYVKDRNLIKIKDLKIGDKVLAWDARKKSFTYSLVYMFAHKDEEAIAEFIKIKAANEKSLTLDAAHLLLVGKLESSKRADAINVGDVLFCMQSSRGLSTTTVTSIEKVEERGFFHPITVEGNLVVNDILATCYSKVEDIRLPGLKKKIRGHVACHSGLLPVRIAYKIGFQRLAQTQNRKMHPYIRWLDKSFMSLMEKWKIDSC